MSSKRDMQRRAAILNVSRNPRTSPDERLVEAVELPTDVHPFFVAAQYHPEFKSRPERPAPLFREFVAAAFAARGGEAREDAADDAHASRRTG